VICIPSLQAASLPPSPFELDDEVVSLAVTGSARAPLVLLARRGVTLLERSGDDWTVAAQVDLSSFIAPGARLARRATGTLEAVGGDDAELRIRVDAPSLGLADPLELRRAGAGFTRMTLPESSPAVPRSSAPAKEALGRTLDWAPTRGDAAFFHLDAENRLVATQATGELLDSAGPVGELLVALPADQGEARVLASSPSLPGEPDRILEFRWRDGRLGPGRRSHEFAGRIAAVAWVESGRDLVAVAVIDRPGHTLLHLGSQDDLWEAP
jgi:hypothetical protein